MNRQPASWDREPASWDRQPASLNRQPASMNWQPASWDRQPASMNRPPASWDRQPASMNRPPASWDREPASLGQPPVTWDGNSSVQDQRPLYWDRAAERLNSQMIQDQRPASLNQQPTSWGQPWDGQVRAFDRQPMLSAEPQAPLESASYENFTYTTGQQVTDLNQSFESYLRPREHRSEDYPPPPPPQVYQPSTYHQPSHDYNGSPDVFPSHVVSKEQQNYESSGPTHFYGYNQEYNMSQEEFPPPPPPSQQVLAQDPRQSYQAVSHVPPPPPPQKPPRDRSRAALSAPSVPEGILRSSVVPMDAAPRDAVTKTVEKSAPRSAETGLLGSRLLDDYRSEGRSRSRGKGQEDYVDLSTIQQRKKLLAEATNGALDTTSIVVKFSRSRSLPRDSTRPVTSDIRRGQTVVAHDMPRTVRSVKQKANTHTISINEPTKVNQQDKTAAVKATLRPSRSVEDIPDQGHMGQTSATVDIESIKKQLFGQLESIVNKTQPDVPTDKNRFTKIRNELMEKGGLPQPQPSVVQITGSYLHSANNDVLLNYETYRESRKPRHSKIEDALTDLEKTYEQLDLDNEDLLDRAERRDISIRNSAQWIDTKPSDSPDVKRLSITNVRMLEEQLQPVHNYAVQWLAKDIVPHKHTDDMAFRRIRTESTHTKSENRNELIIKTGAPKMPTQDPPKQAPVKITIRTRSQSVERPTRAKFRERRPSLSKGVAQMVELFTEDGLRSMSASAPDLSQSEKNVTPFSAKYNAFGDPIGQGFNDFGTTQEAIGTPLANKKNLQTPRTVKLRSETKTKTRGSSKQANGDSGFITGEGMDSDVSLDRRISPATSDGKASSASDLGYGGTPPADKVYKSQFLMDRTELLNSNSNNSNNNDTDTAVQIVFDTAMGLRSPSTNVSLNSTTSPLATIHSSASVPLSFAVAPSKAFQLNRQMLLRKTDATTVDGKKVELSRPRPFNNTPPRKKTGGPVRSVQEEIVVSIPVYKVACAQPSTQDWVIYRDESKPIRGIVSTNTQQPGSDAISKRASNSSGGPTMFTYEGSPIKTSVAQTSNDTAQSQHDVASIKNDVAASKQDKTPTKHDVVCARHEKALSKHNIAQTKYDVAPTKHDITPAKHDVAETKHDTAPIKHDTVITKHGTDTSKQSNNTRGVPMQDTDFGRTFDEEFQKAKATLTSKIPSVFPATVESSGTSVIKTAQSNPSPVILTSKGAQMSRESPQSVTHSHEVQKSPQSFTDHQIVQTTTRGSNWHEAVHNEQSVNRSEHKTTDGYRHTSEQELMHHVVRRTTVLNQRSVEPSDGELTDATDVTLDSMVQANLSQNAPVLALSESESDSSQTSENSQKEYNVMTGKARKLPHRYSWHADTDQPSAFRQVSSCKRVMASTNVLRSVITVTGEPAVKLRVKKNRSDDPERRLSLKDRVKLFEDQASPFMKGPRIVDRKVSD